MCSRGHSGSAVEVLVTKQEVEWVGSLHYKQGGHSGDRSGREAAAAVTAAHQRIGEKDGYSARMTRGSIIISYWRATETLTGDEELEDDVLALDEGGSASDSA